MSGLVIELQADALNRNVPVSDLLRKALVVSKKLDVHHIEEWLLNELNGYGPGSEIPPYREIRGQIKVRNPYHGWVPLNFEDADVAERLSKTKIAQPVSELDYLNTNNSSISMQVPFSQSVVNQLMRDMEVPLQPALIIAPSEIVGILDAIRNNVLDFALQLEKEGIVGEGMSFSKEEKMMASQITYNVTNYIGNMQNSQIQQHSTGAQTMNINRNLQPIKDFVTKLAQAKDDMELSQDARAELSAEITTVETQSKSPNPKNGIIRESLQSIRNILEAAAGNVMAAAFLQELNKLF